MRCVRDEYVLLQQNRGAAKGRPEETPSPTVNIRETQELTPEGRIAAALRVAIFKIAALRKLPANFEYWLPDYADLREVVAPIVRREVLKAELQGLANSSEVARGRRRDEILRELVELDRLGKDKK